MTIEEFNALDASEALAEVLAAAAVSGWARAVVASRPYPGIGALVATALDLAADWGGAEVDEALADHPRIGEPPAGDSPTRAHSSSEQSGLASAERELRERIAAGNRAYEERFGRIYLVRAKGRTPQDILANLTARLTNTPEVEAAVAAHELREIAALRLTRAVSEGVFA